ncbi:MAG TPA: hypothetical protein VHT24_08700, partial [Pseudacidobacterium sp.]|nr:hypothetical protein [Pseudacidobacterium sp.]
MSRIHEALKKAAQERSIRRTEDVSREVADLSAEGLANNVKVSTNLPLEEPREPWPVSPHPHCRAQNSSW